MKSLIVGCSSTHGCDTVSSWYNLENCQHSWANLLSQQLGYEPDNQAIPGNSNEAIFHLAVEQLKNYDLLIVGWTGLHRETWSCEGKNYFFGPIWTCCVEQSGKDYVQTQEYAGVTAVSDQPEMLDIIHAQHKFLFTHKFDRKEQLKKVMNYRHCLKTLCQANNVRYIDANVIEQIFPDVPTVDNSSGRHPTCQQHEDFAKLLSACKE